jgi:hypothetical protein
MTRSAKDIVTVDIHPAELIFSSSSLPEEKKDRLRELSTDVIFELCVKRGVRISFLSLESGSIYPSRNAMIEALFDPNLVRSLIINFHPELKFIRSVNHTKGRFTLSGTGDHRYDTGTNQRKS